MGLIKRTDTPALDKQIYLFFGDRDLCREAADVLQKRLLSEERENGTINSIDGDNEDSARTLGQLLNFSIFPGKQIFRVTDTRLFHSRNVGPAIWERVERAKSDGKETSCRRQLLALAALGGIEAGELLADLTGEQWKSAFGFVKPAGDLSWVDEFLATATPSKKQAGGAGVAARYIDAFTKGVAPQNVLILSAESVDQRTRFFKFIKKEGVVVDCAVDTGASAAAQKGQKEVLQKMVMKTLAGFEKKIQPRALQQLFERVGFHPVAVSMEAEKLALYIGDRDTITVEDLELMVGRTREDALFELTDAFGKRQGARTLVLLHRLQENGMHGLQILATMRNYLRKLLIFKTLQMQPVPMYHGGMNANQFQREYLPALKKREEWTELLKGHPYAVFMSFSKAHEFSCSVLKDWLVLLLRAEFRMKGSPLAADLVLEELFLTLLAAKRQTG
jgi:DNA polymerase-3 subunit delta